jgi:hypothetical protein
LSAASGEDLELPGGADGLRALQLADAAQQSLGQVCRWLSSIEIERIFQNHYLLKNLFHSDIVTPAFGRISDTVEAITG